MKFLRRLSLPSVEVVGNESMTVRVSGWMWSVAHIHLVNGYRTTKDFMDSSVWRDRKREMRRMGFDEVRITCDPDPKLGRQSTETAVDMRDY